MILENHKCEQELGRKKLMLKLPSLRARLQTTTDPNICALFSAYQQSTLVLGRIWAEPDAPVEWIEEYSAIFSEIEGEVSRYFGQDLLRT
jgi:hypothetical protein